MGHGLRILHIAYTTDNMTNSTEAQNFENSMPREREEASISTRDSQYLMLRIENDKWKTEIDDEDDWKPVQLPKRKSKTQQNTMIRPPIVSLAGRGGGRLTTQFKTHIASKLTPHPAATSTLLFFKLNKRLPKP